MSFPRVATTGAPVRVRSRSVPSVDLLAALPRTAPLAWVRRGEGIAGWGEVARIEVSGADRLAQASAWFRDFAARCAVDDEVGLPGSGAVAFGSFCFEDTPGRSVLVVPRVVLGRRAGSAWVTTFGDAACGDPAFGDPAFGDPAAGSGSGDAGAFRAVHPVADPVGVSYAEGSLSAVAWQKVVAEAVERIGRGELEKVVLARDLVATAAQPIDVRALLARLETRYPSCWVFAVDGLVGATPELLVRREQGLVTSRVLAGTIRRTGDDSADLALAASLARSSKDLEEHEYAVRSVAEALSASCTAMNVPESPFVLHLANVMHLATDVTGVLADRSSSLELAAALHPSAAVCGTPTDAARVVIREIEGMDRGRYAGPVGWLDAGGDGEWGIALRCAEIGAGDPCRARLFAGCGIVAGSDPEAELAESQAKFVPMRDALGG